MATETPCRDQYLAALEARDAIADEYSDEYADADAALAVAQDAYRASDEPRTWTFGGDAEGAADQFSRRPDMDAAVDGGDWGVTNDSVAVMVHASCDETGEEISDLVVVDPDEPDCLGDCDHEWVDGQVFGRTAGITHTDHCAICGLSRTTYTCSQGCNAETEHDHDGVRYGDDDWSQAEIAKHHGTDVPDQIVDAAKGEWRTADYAVAKYIARCYGADGSDPGEVLIDLRAATIRSDDRDREIEVWCWHESEAEESGPARWTMAEALADAEARAEECDESVEADEEEEVQS